MKSSLKMKKTPSFRIPSLSFVLGICISCGPSEEQTMPKRENITESVYASGIIKSQNQYQAFANANGLIQEIFLSEGDSVEIGTPILALYNETTVLNRESAELSRAFADQKANQSRIRDLQINIELAQSRKQNDSLLWVRQQRLMNKGIGSVVELEQRKLAFENSKTDYEAAMLKYEDVRREMEYNEKTAATNLAISRSLESDFIVKSKVKGRLYALLRERGEMVTTQTPLAVLGSDSDFRLELQVDEFDIVKVKKGQKIFVIMDSYRGQTFEALITKINPIMDESSKSFTVEAHFVQNPPVLYPNLSLEANILIQHKEDILTLPRSYILEDKFVVTTDRDTLEVVLGLMNFQIAEIIQGLDENVTVIKPIR